VRRIYYFCRTDDDSSHHTQARRTSLACART